MEAKEEETQNGAAATTLEKKTSEEEKSDGEETTEELTEEQREERKRKDNFNISDDIVVNKRDQSDYLEEYHKEVTRFKTLHSKNPTPFIPGRSMDDSQTKKNLEAQNLSSQEPDTKRTRARTVADLNPSEKPSILPNFDEQKTKLKDILTMDKEDTSLETYKKQLLGNLDIVNEMPTEVEVLKISLVTPERPGGNIEMYFEENEPVVDLVSNPYRLKQGAEYHIRLEFKVKNDVVSGLKWMNFVYKGKTKVDSTEEMLGSFAPTKEVHVIDLPCEKAPSGFLSRSTYTGKSMVVDRDGTVFVDYPYSFKVCRKWMSTAELKKEQEEDEDPRV
mmetsp:Transcript_42683/g.49049  ORF Transcript_42683/g.49049 Transcript_42683/m.49049 type:complete len:333 (-) Transcript_42683:72-1070(-)